MAIDPAVLHPLLEEYRFNGAQVFASKLGNIPFNVVLAEELVVAILRRLSETAWFLYSSNNPKELYCFRLDRAFDDVKVAYKRIHVRKIAEEAALSSYLFNRKSLEKCLKRISKNFCPVDLSSIKKGEISLAKKSYRATLATSDILQNNTTLNQIVLHPAFIDEGNRNTAYKTLTKKPAMPFVIWAKGRNSGSSTRKVFYIARRDSKGKMQHRKFSLYLCGLLEDSEKNLYCYFQSKKWPQQSLLENYAKSHNPPISVT